MFYGTGKSYIEFPNKGGLDTQFSITLMCWVEPGGQGGPLFIYGVSNSGVTMLIFSDGDLLIVISERSSLRPLSILGAFEPLRVGKWVHVAAIHDHSSGSNSLYINGHLRDSENTSRGYEIATNAQKVRMGSRDGTMNFKGKIAEMKVYDVALNEAQIQTSIRQGNCTFPVIFASLPFPIFPLIIETPVIEQPRNR